MTIRQLLAVNVGSSTLKAATFEIDASAKASGQRLIEHARTEIPVRGNAPDSFDELLPALLGPMQAPDVVVHRIVHGGDRQHGQEIDAILLAELEAFAPLAPLHQPAALAFAHAARTRWPGARHGAAFDTTFHAGLSPWSRRLPIPAEWDLLGVRRYGFHGLAFASALRTVAARAPDIQHGRAVFAHLGGGCSVCAVKDGVCRDTTMALTPLGGVQGPTRSGDLDPGVVLHLLRRTGLDVDALEARLSREAGLAGISGDGDMRTLLASHEAPAKLAVEQFVVRIAQSIAAMATGIGGLDHLVFSGGIGHRAPAVRERISMHLEWLGVVLDPVENNAGALRIDLRTGPAVWNAAIDEERELARSSLAWL